MVDKDGLARVCSTKTWTGTERLVAVFRCWIVGLEMDISSSDGWLTDEVDDDSGCMVAGRHEAIMGRRGLTVRYCLRETRDEGQ